jgi:DNA-binding LacI/PurR family transcriptional regulator
VSYAGEKQQHKFKDDSPKAWHRVNEELIAKHGKEKAFLTGSNTSCRHHIRSHYSLYKQRCKEANIPVHHWAIPRPIWKEMEAIKSGKRLAKQTNLNGIIKKVTGPSEFTRVALRHAVTQFVACDDQVSKR